MIKVLLGLSMYLFILGSLFSAGLGLTTGEIIEPLKKVKRVLLILLVNFVLIPALACVIAVLYKVDPGLHAGLIIIAGCAGAPFLPKLVGLAKASLAYSVGVMVLLMVVTVFYLPLVMPLVLPGVSVDPFKVAKPLILMMLIPLGLGLFVRAKWPQLASKFKPRVEKIASLSLVIMGVLILLTDYQTLASAYGTKVYAVMGLFTIGALAIGYLFGGERKEERVVMMLGSGARNIAAALLVAATNFSEPRVTTVVLVGSLMQFLFLFPIAVIRGRQAKV